jgi:hypothetical protein
MANVRKPRQKDAGASGRIAAVATEIRLGTEPSRGFLGRRSKRREDAGSLTITKASLILEDRQVLRGRLEIGWDAVRKVVVDDGARWGHVAGACRFAVYDIRADDSGSGTLIGPLWSRAAALMPAGCPSLEIDPVPAEPPNVGLLLEPALRVPLRDGQGGVAAVLMLHAEDPDEARALLSEQTYVGELDHADLGYLEAAAGEDQPESRLVSGG